MLYNEYSITHYKIFFYRLKVSSPSVFNSTPSGKILNRIAVKLKPVSGHIIYCNKYSILFVFCYCKDAFNWINLSTKNNESNFNLKMLLKRNDDLRCLLAEIGTNQNHVRHLKFFPFVCRFVVFNYCERNLCFYMLF